MAVYTPKTVSSDRELLVALKAKERCICVTNEEFFWDIQKRAEKVKAAKRRKTVGKTGMLAGALGTLILSGGASFFLLGGSALFTALAHQKDAFKNYDLYIDYQEHRIILIRNKSSDPFDKNKDKIIGIDMDQLDNLTLLDRK